MEPSRDQLHAAVANQRLDNTIEVGAPADGMRTVKIRTNSERLSLAHRFQVVWKGRSFNTDKRQQRRCNFVSVNWFCSCSAWIPLSISAGRELIRRARYDRITFQQQQLDRLAEAVVTNQLSPIGNQLTIRLLSLQSEIEATTYLSRLLLKSANLSVQRAAARVLGKLNTDAAHQRRHSQNVWNKIAYSPPDAHEALYAGGLSDRYYALLRKMIKDRTVRPPMVLARILSLFFG